MKRNGAVVFVLIYGIFLFISSTSSSQPPAQILTLATTTSTADSGLLDLINPLFEAQFNAKVKVLSLGTGAALRVAENGDADVVLVHARSAEDAFLQAGHGINRRDVMFNDFVIVGPAADPAGVRGVSDVLEAFSRIAESGSPFISRGDQSGTHQKELSIWDKATIKPSGTWYLIVGKGMGDTLVQSNELGAYTLSDRGTYLALRENLALQILVEGPVKGGDPFLLNSYGVMAVNPAKYPDRNYALAMAYIGFLTSSQTQQRIGNFRIGNEPLFFPDALSETPNFEQYIPSNANAP